MLSRKRISILFGLGLASLSAALPFSIKLTSIITVLLVLLWIVEGNWQYKWHVLKHNHWLQLFLGFYLLHILGLLYTQNLSAGFFDLEKKLSLLLFPLIIGSSSSLYTGNSLRNRIHAFLITSCFATLLFCLCHGIYRFMEGIPPSFSVYGGFEATQQFKAVNKEGSDIWGYITYSELLSPIELHPTYFSIFVLLILGILLKELTSNGLNKKQYKQHLQLFLFAFFTMSIFLLASRIAIILYILLLPFQLFWQLRRKISLRSVIVVGASFLILITVLINYVPVVKHRFTNDIMLLNQPYDSNNPGTGMMMRLAFWQTASDVIKKSFVVGVGTGDYEEAMNLQYVANNMAELQGYNPHNQYLQTGVMLGFIGVSYLILILLLPIMVAWRRRDNIYIVFLLIISVSLLTESVLQTNKGIVFYALFNSLYLFQNSDKKYNLNPIDARS